MRRVTRRKKAKGKSKQKTIARVVAPKRAEMHYAKAPFPPMLLTKLTYAEDVLIDNTTSTGGTYTFRSNSLFDPNYTGTGGQPRYYDTLVGANGGTAPYRTYTVYASAIKVTCFQNYTANVAAQGILAITKRPTTSTSPSSMAEAMMREDTVYTGLSQTTGNKALVELKSFCKIADIIGVDDIFDSAGAATAYNADPTNPTFWDISIWNGGAAAQGQWRCLVEITYYAQLSVKNDVADS